MAAHEQYLLHLADNALILGQRNAEWCGHGPVLEEDLALANNSLDLIGQARLLYQRVAALRNDGKTSEDLLAYFRNEPEFRNYTLVEIAHSTALTPTAAGGYVTTGKLGVHSEHMGFVLAEMQSLARVHPEAVW